jgi:Tfp pilus assembly protein FimT
MRHARGFTFFEILVVMGLCIVVGGFALFVSMETYRGSNFHADRNLLVAALQRARAQSMNNMCSGTCTDGKPHGVKILSNNTITLFQGASYATRDNAYDSVFTMNVATTTAVTEVVFTQLSGGATPAMIVLTGSDKISTTTVSAEGQITWTN